MINQTTWMLSTWISAILVCNYLFCLLAGASEDFCFCLVRLDYDFGKQANFKIWFTILALFPTMYNNHNSLIG